MARRKLLAKTAWQNFDFWRFSSNFSKLRFSFTNLVKMKKSSENISKKCLTAHIWKKDACFTYLITSEDRFKNNLLSKFSSKNSKFYSPLQLAFWPVELTEVSVSNNSASNKYSCHAPGSDFIRSHFADQFFEFWRFEHIWPWASRSNIHLCTAKDVSRPVQCSTAI